MSSTNQTETAQGEAESPHRTSVLRDVSASALTAGFIAVAISYAGPLLVVLEAARAAGLSPELTASWVWAISIGSGSVCLLFSWITRQPVMVAWSIPGAALLITVLPAYVESGRLGEVIGAYILCGVLGLLLGATGLFGWLLRVTPKPITAAVLAGVLLPFSINVAKAVVEAPIVAGGLVIGYLIGRRLVPRYAVFVAMALGGILAGATGSAHAFSLVFEFTTPQFVMPAFSWSAAIGLALPLLIVTAAGQNAPGLIVMHQEGYDCNDRLLIGASSVASAIFALFGSHALNLAAVTAAIATSEDSHPDPDRRYIAGMSCGVFYIIGGFLATFIVSLFSSIPPSMITALAGVALLAPLQNSLHGTMHADGHPETVTHAALITLAVTVSGVQPFGVASAFWGLAAGIVAHLILRPRRMKDADGTLTPPSR